MAKAKPAKKTLKAKTATKARATVVSKASPAKLAELTRKANKAATKADKLSKRAARNAVAANATAFTLGGGEDVPARSRGGVEPIYPFASMNPAPQENSFFTIVTQIDSSSYPDETEARKAQKEANNTVVNRLTGAVRRYVKRTNTAARFSARAKIVEGVNVVRVYRTV